MAAQLWPSWTIGLFGLVVLAGAIPWVARIRHPDQKPFAAYLLFVSVFAIVAAATFGLLGFLLGAFDVAGLLREPGYTILFILLVFVPALWLGTWQARKPPISRGPPP